MIAKLKIENNIEAKNAVPKLSTLKPLTIVATNQNKKALITKVNIPSVKIFTGKDKMNIIGLISALTNPKTKTVIKAE